VTNDPTLRCETIDADAFEALAHDAGLKVPIEQAAVWDRFDAAIEGRSHLVRLAVGPTGGAPVALVSLTTYSVRGFPYVWARHAPLMLVEPTPEAELAVRAALVRHSKDEWPQVVFLRLQAHHEAPDLNPLLQTITYDETVTVDLTPSEDEIMASMGKTGRKKLRRTLRDEGFSLTEERGISREGFDELYGIYRETADRDGFGIYPAELYYSMLETLGDAARLFVARRTDGPGAPGRAVSWVLSTFYDGVGQDYYGGSNLEGFETNAALRLKWHILMSLKADGGERYDLMGVGSAKAPQLMGVRQFKLQFAEETTPVAPSYDVPVKSVTYYGLRWALAAKHLLKGSR
jgi:Acetyltransferase (GNAT) domain